MPLKLNVAISRKIGQANYGSRGATVGLEMEVDSGLVDEPRQFHERIARLFQLAAESVNRELGDRAPHPGDNGKRPEPRAATPAQIRAIHAIARRRNLDLLAALSGGFGVNRPEQLSLEEASQLIEDIARPHNGVPG
jgi:hypothetical protein